MRRLSVFVAAISLVAACGQTPAPSGHDASVLPSVADSAAASASARASAAVAVGDGDAFVATLSAVAGVLTGELLVEAVAPDGNRVTVATIPNVTAGLPDGTRILEGEPIRVSPSGHLTVAVEGPFDAASGADDRVARRLIFDLGDPTKAPLVVAGGTPAWSPDGRLAITSATGVTFVDPVAGSHTTIVDPDGVDAADVWAADGSGLLASRYDGSTDSSTAGVLGLDGRFVAGVQPPWQATGRDRPFGAEGTFVSDSLSEGPKGSEQAIVEQRASRTRPAAWLTRPPARLRPDHPRSHLGFRRQRPVGGTREHGLGPLGASRRAGRHEAGGTQGARHARGDRRRDDRRGRAGRFGGHPGDGRSELGHGRPGPGRHGDRSLGPPREREWPVVLRRLGRPSVGATIARP